MTEIRACRVCAQALPHTPRPVLRLSTTAQILICGQAPGTRVHASGTPFTDPSGVRLRAWMGVSDEEFYDLARVAVVPMGMCFPGLDKHGGDLPPRKECAPLWRPRLAPFLSDVRLTLAVGSYAHKWFFGDMGKKSMTDTVRAWREAPPNIVPLPHPSWRNNHWIKTNPWFEDELLPVLRAKVRAALSNI
ncbi:MAG: uracil-DNA glycosylase family protein [Caulobacterales bacterium]